MRRLVILMGILLFLAGCHAQEQRQPSFTVIMTEGEQTKVVMQPAGDTAVFDITSPTGLGGANVQLQSGEWQPTIILRFHLNGLEEMTLTYGEPTAEAAATTITLNISSIDSQVFQAANDEPIGEDSPYWMEVALFNEDGTAGQLPLQNGTIELTLPPDFHAQDPASFHINWIDFYR
jgi:hypothetical protein